MQDLIEKYSKELVDLRDRIVEAQDRDHQALIDCLMYKVQVYSLVIQDLRNEIRKQQKVEN